MSMPYAEVIGDPIDHSKSPLIHKFWLEKLGLPGDYRTRRVPSGKLGAYLEERRPDRFWRGCNVTSPHKIAMMELVPLLGDIRGTFGAINTVFRHTLDIPMGINTDGVGVTSAIRKHLLDRGPDQLALIPAVQIIGAGGAARGAAAGLKSIGFVDFYFYNRTVEGARTLARWMGLDPDRHAAGLDALGPLPDDRRAPGGRGGGYLIVNMSSMGMEGKPAVPIDLAAYPPETLVFDAVYAPVETPLLKAAHERGLPSIDGISMLIEQADMAFHLFFRSKPPRQSDAELRERLRR
jgi:shikimate dehydrogenase